MIEKLCLKNVILIDACEITFAPGLNILTGETGAGKSAIMQALNLLLGARADQQIVRKGAEKATIEAHISGKKIVREVPGKCWIDDQPATSNQLQHLCLAELIGQGAYHSLKSPAEQLKLLDTYGKCDRLAFSEAYARVLELGTPPDRLALAEIQALNLQEGEEEELFAELEKMSNFQDYSIRAQAALEGMNTVLEDLANVQKQTIEGLDANALIQSACADLQEAHFQYSHYFDTLEYDAERFAYVEERLGEINRLKRKVNCNFDQLKAFEAGLASYDESYREAIETRDQLAAQLKEQRTHAAKNLSEKLTAQMRSLNMPHATMNIEVLPSPLSITGTEKIQFTLAANPGEAAVPIHKRASGGELSRLMLALKLVTCDHLPTLIFDEIDSNIGGETASLIGQKLKALGEKQQVICITHFAQVARFADHHLHIAKEEKNGRTFTSVTPLSDPATELKRMLGGEKFTKKLQSS